MSWRDPVDVSDEATVRRSEGGFTEPLPAPERAQDGDMSIPELGVVDRREQCDEVDPAGSGRCLLKEGHPGAHRTEAGLGGNPSPGPGRRVQLVLDVSEDAPWGGVETASQAELTKELGAATKHALRASKWAKILADVDDETTVALRDVAERLRTLRDGLAKGPR